MTGAMAGIGQATLGTLHRGDLMGQLELKWEWTGRFWGALCQWCPSESFEAEVVKAWSVLWCFVPMLPL